MLSMLSREIKIHTGKFVTNTKITGFNFFQQLNFQIKMSHFPEHLFGFTHIEHIYCMYFIHLCI